jgi:propionate CoA-transferase
MKAGQTVLYVTERAVFALREDGVHLLEIAPGIDLQGDVLDRMAFAPRMDAPPRVMDAGLFRDDSAEKKRGESDGR